MDYNGGDAFNQLRQKVGELRQRKDHLQGELSRDQQTVNHLDAQLQQLDRDRRKVLLDIESKEVQKRKYQELIDQSETALNKMISNTQKLNDALSNAINTPNGL